MGKDPYRYFRIEAREHVEGLSAGVLELEKHADDRELVGRLLRHAHTLKGAARVVRQPEISELSHSIEEVLAAIRDGQGTADRTTINKLLQLVDTIGHHVGSLGGPESSPAPGAGQAVSPAPAEHGNGTAALDTVRVGIDELDPLLHSIWEVGINVGALRQQAKTLDRILESDGGRDATGMPENVRSALRQFRRTFLTQVEKAERELLQLQDRTGQLRLLPASSLFPSLERACRDAADALGKRVEFHATGGENRLDTHVLRGLSDALLHLVRNAVSHGIESPDERGAAGKAAAGRVEVAVERRGNRVTFVCRDDGRGVDATQIRRAAATRGWVPAEGDEGDALSPEQAVRLLFRGGISTADAVTHHAGRGVGLDVVRETAERLDGTVEMRSTPPAGTVIRVTVPISLESMVVLDVEVAGHRVSLPFDAVRRVINVPDADVAHTPGGDSILCDGAPVPIVPLRRLLFANAQSPSSPEPSRRTLVIQSGEARVAIIVDRLLGRNTVVLKPLPSVIAGAELVLGACLDASGDPQPVLDPDRLVDAASRIDGSAVSAAPAPKPCVLVIDDSLTTRMLEQSILEAAGYEVDLAVSGEDGLAKAKRREYRIFVVDVEMPGMSGFDFVATVKSDPDLQRIPAILVTSRDAPEDRARGQTAGATAYIVKSEFEEATFLGTIRRLAG